MCFWGKIKNKKLNTAIQMKIGTGWPSDSHRMQQHTAS